MSSNILSMDMYQEIAMTQKRKHDPRFEQFVANVLTANNCSRELSSNEMAFLRNRYKEGVKAVNVVI